MSKKKKNADFQKVKLKVGRKVQRATNETKAQFKVKSINISSQFKQSAVSLVRGEVTKKDVNIKELLKHCINRSASFRLQALTSFCEYLASLSPSAAISIYFDHLGPILEVSGSLFVDDDAKVRVEARKLLKLVVCDSKVSEVDVCPFFSLIVARLCCAMTHLHEDIRLDSLLVLDILLDQFPFLIAQYALRLLPNFISLIARPRQVRADASGHRQQKSSSLIVNPSSHMSTQKWRVKVLKRLSKLFSAIVSHGTRNEDTSHTDFGAVAIDVTDNSDVGCCIYGPNRISARSISAFTLRTCSEDAMGTNSENLEKIKSWIQTLIPLLVDCWVEAGLNSSDHCLLLKLLSSRLCCNCAGQTLTDETLSVARAVLSVTTSLFQYVCQGFENSRSLIDWVSKTYEKQFIQCFMSDFPFVIESIHTVKKRKHDGERALDIGFSRSSRLVTVSINLSICLVMVDIFKKPSEAGCEERSLWLTSPSVGLKSSRVTTPVWLQQIIDYIVDLLNSQLLGKNSLQAEHLSQISTLTSKLVGLQVDNDSTGRLLKACCDAALRHDPLSNHSRCWFDILAKVFLEKKQHGSCEAEVASTWMSSLPNMFLICGPVGDEHAGKILRALLKAGSQKNPCFLECFQNVLSKFLDKSFLITLPQELVHGFVESFSWVQRIDTEHIQLLAALAVEGVLSPACVRKLLGILQYRCEVMEIDEENVGIDENCLVLFLLTVLLGASDAELKKAENDHLHNVIDGGNQLYVCCDVSSLNQLTSRWRRQLLLTEHVFQVVNMTRRKQQIVYLLSALLRRILVHYRVLPLFTACAVAVSMDWLLQNDALKEDFPCGRLLTGVFRSIGSYCTVTALHDSERILTPDNVQKSFTDAEIEDLQRDIAGRCAKVVCKRPLLLSEMKDVMNYCRLSDTFSACVSAFLPQFQGCS